MARMMLDNGKSVVKPFNKVWIVLVILVGLVVGFWQFIRLDPGYNPEGFRLDQLWIIVEKLFTPQRGRDWSDLFRYMLTLENPLLQTLKMCFAGTIIGSLMAFPLAILSAKNIVKTPIIYWPMRILMNLIRTIPTMVLAVIAVIFVGTGLLAGIIALILFTFGIMSKMLYEVIETIDMGSYEALESTGANKVQSFRFAVLPQIFPIFLGYILYIFEINIRSSAILAYVGAEGIGTPIRDNTLYNYDYVGATIIVLLALILIVQGISGLVRRKLQ